MKTFLDMLQEKVVIFDGATGTHLQGQGLSAEDFGGEHLNGCNEYLVVSKPAAVQRVHSDYLEAGCDVVETDSFGGTAIVLAEYGLAARVHELNRKAAELAREVASGFSRGDRPRFVAGSMGPTTKAISVTSGVSFPALREAYREQAAALVEGGADLLLVETCQDTRNIKAALLGIRAVEQEVGRRIPAIGFTAASLP